MVLTCVGIEFDSMRLQVLSVSLVLGANGLLSLGCNTDRMSLQKSSQTCSSMAATCEPSWVAGLPDVGMLAVTFVGFIVWEENGG